MKTLLLSMDDVRKALSMEEVIDGVKEGYLAFNAGSLQQPDIVSMEMPQHNGETDIKSCYNGLNESISVKVASGFYDNGKTNDLPTMIGMIQLYNGENGAPMCIMDGSLITDIRTGAAGAISSELLSRKDSKTVAVIGAGGQARMQVYALTKVRNIETVKVFGRSLEEMKKYKEDVEKETGLKVIICETVNEVMENADIAISTTPTKDFIVPADLVKPGMHIVAVGADMAGKNEWDPEIFENAKIVNDSIAQCVSRGETRNAIVKGIITKEDIYGEIGELVASQKPGRLNDQELTIFDTTGMGVQDNVTAMKVYKIAKGKGLGTYFEFLKGGE